MLRETVARFTIALDDYEHFTLEKIMEFYQLDTKSMAVRKAIHHAYTSLRRDEPIRKTNDKYIRRRKREC